MVHCCWKKKTENTDKRRNMKMRTVWLVRIINPSNMNFQLKFLTKFFFFFWQTWNILKAKQQPQGLYSYKPGYKIDQKGLASTVGTSPQAECLIYKYHVD